MGRSGASNVVGVGVVGLGRRWADRYRSALARPGGRARVVALCDPVAHRAEAEADRLGCDAVEGVTVLIDRPDVEVLFVLDPAWFGPWPIRAAVARGKAVFSAIGHRATLGELESLGPARPAAGAAPPIVMTELAGRFAPEMLRLRELLATELGPARRVRIRGVVGADGPSDAAIGLLDRCRALLPGAPAGAKLVRTRDDPGRRLRVVSIDGPGGEEARLSLSCRRAPADPDGPAEAEVTLLVEAERGRARIDRGGRLHWSARGSRATEPTPIGSATDLMVDHVFRRLRGEQSLAPDLDELLDLERSSRVFEW